MIKLSSSSFNSHNKKPQKKNNSTLSRKRPIAKLFTIAAIGIVLVIGFVLLNSSTPKKGMNQEEQKMALYLKEKYGKEFIVENYRVEGAGLGVEGDPTADVHPRDDTTIRFLIWDRGKNKEGKHAYSDEYPGALWAKEETENIRPRLQEIFGYVPEYDVRIHTAAHLDGKIKGKVGSFENAAQEYGDKIAYTLEVKTDKPLNEDSMTKEYLQVTQQVLNKNVNIIVFSYSKIINENTVRGIALDGKEIKDIQSPSQLKNKFKNWNIR